MNETIRQKTEFTTLMLHSRILGEIIKELDLKSLRVTHIIISADKQLAHTTEKKPIPELEQYFRNQPMETIAHTQRFILHLPLFERSQVEQRIKIKTAAKEEGLDLEYINKVLTNSPYDFPFVKVEEFTATILKPEQPIKLESQPETAAKIQEPSKPKVSLPQTVTFKRTEVKQPQIKKTLSKTLPYGRKYAMELQTTRTKSQVEIIRELISPKALMKLCQLRKTNTVTLDQVCEEIEKEAAQ
jgi:hypothetical protein